VASESREWRARMIEAKHDHDGEHRDESMHVGSPGEGDWHWQIGLLTRPLKQAANRGPTAALYSIDERDRPIVTEMTYVGFAYEH